LISKIWGYEKNRPSAFWDNKRRKHVEKCFSTADCNRSEEASRFTVPIFAIRDLVKGLGLGSFEPLDAGSTELALTFAGDVRAREPLRVDFDEVFVEGFFRREFKDSP
jgi:hypothetical protein